MTFTSIPAEELDNCGIYLVSARNFNIGVWKESIQAFLGIRLKFGSTYIDHEFYPGSAYPLRRIGTVHEDRMDYESLMDILSHIKKARGNAS